MSRNRKRKPGQFCVPVEHCVTLATRELIQAGLIGYHPDGAKRVLTLRDGADEIGYRIELQTYQRTDALWLAIRFTVANYRPADTGQTVQIIGHINPLVGVQWFMLCPKCGGQRRKIHCLPDDTVFACKACHGLLYESQTLSGMGRVAFYAFKKEAARNRYSDAGP